MRDFSGPVEVPLLSGYEARYLLSLGRCGEVDVSLDLGVSASRGLVCENGVSIDDVKISRWMLEKAAARPEDVYVVEEGLPKLAWFEEKVYRLVAPGWRKPTTVEINGIRMHRTVDVNPMDDARQKVELFRELDGAEALDICTGLGYTAIAMLAKGVRRVVTVEKDPNIVKMAALNPWSRQLFTGKIERIVNDAVDFLRKCVEEFDVVMHDPPSFRVAGELYSTEFYKLLYRVVRRGGVVVHYVGQPGVKKGLALYRGVIERMRKAGFKAVYIPETLCVRAVKV
ncbi:MAG: RsmD family RNA methyltransferase [Candidatus Caldarchaeum sp.]|uniref:SAM-dependent methyltransferase n=1 Tax=Caldiarchaeum subterraneum TaxID=311458 RepID=A0A7C4I438_CALS0